MSYTYHSAFAGIGGMTMGLKPLGFKGVTAWEYDPTTKIQHAQNAHKLLHPEIEVQGDIREVNVREISHVDLFCFTPPCQAFSMAGAGHGTDFICLDCGEIYIPDTTEMSERIGTCPECEGMSVPQDDRGVLTFDALKIVQATRPKMLFMENVKGLLSHGKGHTLTSIVELINSLGYLVDFRILNSKYFDVAQNRERIYLVAVREDLKPAEGWHIPHLRTVEMKRKQSLKQKGVKAFNFNWPEQEEIRTSLREFLEPYVEDKYYIAQKRVYPLAEELEKTPLKDIPKNTVVRVTLPNGYEAEYVFNTLFNYFVANSFLQETRGTGYRFKLLDSESSDGIASTITVREGLRMESNYLVEAVPLSEGSLTFSLKCPEIDKFMDTILVIGRVDYRGFDLNKRVYGVNGQAPAILAQSGGNNHPKVAETLLKLHMNEGTEELYDILTEYRVRRLTPVECLRLQAVPEEAIETLREHFTDSQLYKFAGNGLTTTVITAIGKEIKALLDEVSQ